MPRLTGFAPVPIRGPAPRWPLGAFGAVLGFFGDPVGTMLRLHREHGAIAAVADRNPALVCAFGAALNQAVITDPARFAHSSEVPVRAPAGSALARFNRVLPFTNGEEHARRRRLLMPAFRKNAIDGYAPLVLATTDAVLDRWPIDAPTDLARDLRRLTAAIAVAALFGLDPDAGGADLGEVEARLLEALSSPWSIALPWRLPGTPFARAVRGAEEVDRRLRALLAARRASLDPGARDALSILLKARDQDGSALTDDELVGECNGLFVAGYDTSAQTLAWTLALLALHPPVAAALREELRDTLGGRPPTPEDLERLPHLDRVIQESMRLLPAAPMLFLRTTATEAPLGPHTLPAEANVVLSPLITHRDPALFPDPTVFRPDRWLQVAPGPYAFLPFGAGPRMCLGAAFAKQLVRLALARLLQRFTPVVRDGADLSRGMHGIALAPRHGLPGRWAPAATPIPPRPDLAGDWRELVTVDG